jgi:hypothetical protein
MSIKLCQQDGLYYSTTDMFIVDTNPHSRYSPFVGSTFTDLAPDLHLIDDDDSSNCSEEYDDLVSPVDPTTVKDDPATTTTADTNVTPLCLPRTPTEPAPSRPLARAPRPCSWVSVHPTNLARQLELELWAACLGHCGKDQLITLANRADGLPNIFNFHPFWHIDWKVQARIRKSAARRIARKVDQVGTRFYMDVGFIRASSVNYLRPNINRDCVINSYDGYSSYLLIVDDKSSMMWIFLTRSKSPPLDIVRLFLQTFGHDRNVGRFLPCNQGGELARSHALVDMALTEFGYKVELTGANSLSQNGQAMKWNNTFAITTRALLYGAALEPKYWSAALLHAAYLHNRCAHCRTGITPFKGWWGIKPNLRYLKLLVHVSA